MTTARAVAVVEPGGPDVLRVVEREVREPSAGEVRIAVRAAAVNPTDIALRRRGVEGVAAPWVPGMDAAGVVESVGPGVEHVAPGDEVMAAVLPRRPEGGAQAELIVVPARSVVAVPAGATFEQAATLPMNGLTALLGLELLDLPAGSSLLVTEAPVCLRRTRSRSRNGRVCACLPMRAPPTRLSCAASAPTTCCRAASRTLPRSRMASSTRPCEDATPSARSAPAAGSRSCARGTAGMSRTG